MSSQRVLEKSATAAEASRPGVAPASWGDIECEVRLIEVAVVGREGCDRVAV
jgi:hypothetical protein